MLKILLTILRYTITAVGSGEVIAASDTTTQVVSAVAAAGATIWGLVESKKHADLAAK